MMMAVSRLEKDPFNCRSLVVVEVAGRKKVKSRDGELSAAEMANEKSSTIRSSLMYSNIAKNKLGISNLL